MTQPPNGAPASDSYAAAGVDIDAGAALVRAIKPAAAATARPGALGGLGGFGGLFDPAAAGYRDPILVAAADGVGTKLKLAQAAGRLSGLGADLVAMCVNDLVVQGAEPLFFLDYFAAGRLELAAAATLVESIAAACRDAGCALIGGETAEMPGLYAAGDFDLAGFAVGAVERGRLLDGEDIRSGDVVIGLASHGLHANGFSLARRVIADSGADVGAAAPFACDAPSLGHALLTPTRIYVKSCLAAHRAGLVKGFAHITGGGLIDNPPRVLGADLAARMEARAWTPPAVFGWLARAGGVPSADMARTFNCGVGMIAYAAPNRADALLDLLRDHGERAFVIGAVAARDDGPAATIEGLSDAWFGP